VTDHAAPHITVNEVGDVVLDDASADQVPADARRVRVLPYFLPDGA
jgi:hypothetical protein